MKRTNLICLLLAAALCISGCSGNAEISAGRETVTETSAVTETTAAAETTETQTETTTAPPPEPYTFNPHVYSPMFAPVIPQENWDAFHHLCDALRAGETTFACASQEAYAWATDTVVLGHLFPAACTKITGESSDGTVPFENGIGRIYYQIPIAEYTERQKQFEDTVTEVLNSWLEPDDDDFEKCLKLYHYMEATYDYESMPMDLKEGAHYYTFMNRKGICSQLSGVYAYLLLQVGVDATEVGCFAENMSHAWTYVKLNGQGYHIDPTWSLMSYLDTDQLSLEYFMMTDEHRINDGCPVDDLTVDLLPGYWVNQSTLTFPATDDRYSVGNFANLNGLDEKNKILRYTDISGETFEMHYG